MSGAVQDRPLDTHRINSVVDVALKGHPERSGRLLNVLSGIQREFRYLPAQALYEVSVRLDIPFAHVMEVVSAFNEFSVEPVGEHLILVCDGTACHAAGALNIVKALEQELGIRCGETTSDGAFTLKTVYCVGSCGLAPIVLVDAKSFGRVRLREAAGIPRAVMQSTGEGPEAGIHEA